MSDGGAGMAMLTVGVDGCPGGWVAVTWDSEAGSLAVRVHRSFAELLAAYEGAAAIGVDIPIGLAEGAPRGADRAARRVLGPRASSVFPAPDPRLLEQMPYADALARSRQLLGKGISRQAHAIYPKVAEVNALMTPELQRRVVEVHPEVSFATLNGGPMMTSKRTPEGYEERRALLAAGLGLGIWDRATARGIARPAGADDVLDATVAAWSARRLALGVAGRLPEPAEVDARGIRMEIVF